MKQSLRIPTELALDKSGRGVNLRTSTSKLNHLRVRAEPPTLKLLGHGASHCLCYHWQDRYVFFVPARENSVGFINLVWLRWLSVLLVFILQLPLSPLKFIQLH